jgi:hypothetical protein
MTKNHFGLARSSGAFQRFTAWAALLVLGLMFAGLAAAQAEDPAAKIAELEAKIANAQMAGDMPGC